jgi:alpha-tubulin suppressor-like RCC1 family protein
VPATGVISPVEAVQQLALGAYHSCALVVSGRVACWGDNQQGQLGDGSRRPSTAPVWVAGLDDVVELRASDAATCARRRDGAVVCWGGNAHGEAAPRAAHDVSTGSAGATDRVGEPSSYAPGNTVRRPAELTELRGARALAMGARHACALGADGRVTCWGDASFGQLGAGVADAFQRREVAGVPPLVEISAAGVDTCGRTASGEVWCWGGELAGGSTPPSAARANKGPAPIASVAGATHVEVYMGRACAWNVGGDVSCWGDSGGCGDTDRGSPAALVAEYRGSVTLARAAGGCFWCVLRPSHELSCDRPPPQQGQLSLPRTRSVVAGNDHACAILDEGSVWCWGSNVRGELGRPTPQTRDPDPAPVQWQEARADAPKGTR